MSVLTQPIKSMNETHFSPKMYTIEDYTGIIFDNGYKIPQEVDEIIKTLANLLNVNNIPIIQTTKKSIGDSHNKYGGGGGSKHKHRDDYITINNNAWESLRSFKSTIIEKKEGIEKTISEIRVILNKISVKNYENIKVDIFKSIKELSIEESKTPEDGVEEQTEKSALYKVATSIFEIASSNIFFSKLYATLYKELLDKNAVFDEILQDFISKYVEKFNHIKVVQSTDNYDEFSEYNKTNDSRKATSTFIANLVKENVISLDTLVDIIIEIQTIIFTYIREERCSTTVEEITENLYILLQNCSSYISKDEKKHNIILSNILMIKAMKPKEVKSLSSRTYFKFMDMTDLFKI